MNREYITSNPYRESINLRKLLPNPLSRINVNNSLVDRSGMLHDNQLLSNRRYVLKHLKKSKIIGCCQGRLDDWLHINSNLDIFLCCNDFYFETSIGNLSQIIMEDDKKLIFELKFLILYYNAF